MRKIIAIISILLSLSSYAGEQCNHGQEDASPKGSADFFAQKISIVVSKASDDLNVKVQSGAAYLGSIQTSTNFLEKDANSFITSIMPICENNKLDAKFRSRACIIISGLHGKLAQKLQMSGMADGKIAYKYLQKSLELDPLNVEAVTGHAIAIIGLSDQGYIVRKLAERGLNTNIKDEAMKAKGNLERINQTSNPLYKQILNII